MPHDPDLPRPRCTRCSWPLSACICPPGLTNATAPAPAPDFAGRTLAHSRALGPVPPPTPGYSFAVCERTTDLYRELARAAITWGVADRVVQTHAGALADIVHEMDDRAQHMSDDRGLEELRQKRDAERRGLAEAKRRAEHADDHLHVMAKRLIAELEGVPQ